MVKRALFSLALAGCQELEAPMDPPALDQSAFRCEVEPVLVARCSFYACHGSNQRPLRLFAVNRLRLDPPEGLIGAPLTDNERRANYEMATAFADPAQLDESLLLLKPLDDDAGGFYHGGATRFGDVFATSEDPGYQIIARWLDGETAASACEPIEEVGP